jgi:hypothetical protein
LPAHKDDGVVDAQFGGEFPEMVVIRPIAYHYEARIGLLLMDFRE